MSVSTLVALQTSIRRGSKDARDFEAGDVAELRQSKLEEISTRDTPRSTTDALRTCQS